MSGPLQRLLQVRQDSFLDNINEVVLDFGTGQGAWVGVVLIGFPDSTLTPPGEGFALVEASGGVADIADVETICASHFFTLKLHFNDDVIFDCVLPVFIKGEDTTAVHAVSCCGGSDISSVESKVFEPSSLFIIGDNIWRFERERFITMGLRATTPAPWLTLITQTIFPIILPLCQQISPLLVEKWDRILDEGIVFPDFIGENIENLTEMFAIVGNCVISPIALVNQFSSTSYVTQLMINFAMAPTGGWEQSRHLKGALESVIGLVQAKTLTGIISIYVSLPAVAKVTNRYYEQVLKHIRVLNTGARNAVWVSKLTGSEPLYGLHLLCSQDVTDVHDYLLTIDGDSLFTVADITQRLSARESGRIVQKQKIKWDRKGKKSRYWSTY